MTYQHVVVVVKTTGPDPEVHIPVEIAWWDLASGHRGRFVPAHDIHDALSRCDVDTINAIGYTTRLAKPELQDTEAYEAARLADALQGAVLVTMDPVADARLLTRMYAHYLNDFEVHQRLTMPQWHGVLDAGAYAAGVLGLPTVPDLSTICEYSGVFREAAGFAETDTDALGRAMMRLAELADAAKHRQSIPAYDQVPASGELATALAARLTRETYDLVTFHDDDGSYTVNTDLIGHGADQVYGSVIRDLMAERDRGTQQLREMADATQRASNEYQAKVEELRTLPLDPDMHAMIKTAVDTAPDGEAAATAVLDHVRAWWAAQQSIINGLLEHNAVLDRELEQVQKSRQAWAIEALDTELSVTTPWDGLATSEPAEPEDREVLVVGPMTTEDIVTLARFVSPIKGGCPNSPSCGHPGWAHDIEDHGDPLPTCGAAEGDTDCRCGHAPTGFRRAIPMRVWQPGDTVPADVFAYSGQGDAVLYEAHEWVNDTGLPLVELAPRGAPDRELDTVEDTAPAAEVAG